MPGSILAVVCECRTAKITVAQLLEKDEFLGKIKQNRVIKLKIYSYHIFNMI